MSRQHLTDANAPKLSPIPAPRKRCVPSLTLLNEQQFVLGMGGRDLKPCLPDMDIDLAAHTEPPRKVDPRLHGEAHTRDQGPLVRGLEVVEMGPRAVEIAVDRVPGTVH